MHTHCKDDAEFLSVGVDAHILKYNGINKRNAVGIHVCLCFLSILKDSILAQFIIKLM